MGLHSYSLLAKNSTTQEVLPLFFLFFSTQMNTDKVLFYTNEDKMVLGPWIAHLNPFHWERESRVCLPRNKNPISPTPK